MFAYVSICFIIGLSNIFDTKKTNGVIIWLICCSIFLMSWYNFCKFQLIWKRRWINNICIEYVCERFKRFLNMSVTVSVSRHSNIAAFRAFIDITSLTAFPRIKNINFFGPFIPRVISLSTKLSFDCFELSIVGTKGWHLYLTIAAKNGSSIATVDPKGCQLYY